MDVLTELSTGDAAEYVTIDWDGDRVQYLSVRSGFSVP